jgi:hypothetical protein
MPPATVSPRFLLGRMKKGSGNPQLCRTTWSRNRTQDAQFLDFLNPVKTTSFPDWKAARAQIFFVMHAA